MIYNGSSLTFSAQGGRGKEKEFKSAEKIFCRSEDGSAGGGWGEECRAVRAKNRGRTRRPARSEQNTTEKFCFPFRRKNRPRAKSEMRTKLFFGGASVSERRRGGFHSSVQSSFAQSLEYPTKVYLRIFEACPRQRRGLGLAFPPRNSKGF